MIRQFNVRAIYFRKNSTTYFDCAQYKSQLHSYASAIAQRENRIIALRLACQMVKKPCRKPGGLKNVIVFNKSCQCTSTASMKPGFTILN